MPANVDRTEGTDMRKRFLIAVALVAAVGCGKSEAEKQAEKTQEAARQVAQGAEQAAAGAKQAAQGAQQGGQQLAKGLEQFAKGLAQMAQSSSNATVIDFEVLKTMVPEISGWTRSDLRGEQISMGAKMSKAGARFEKGDSSFKLEILDSSFNQLFLAPMSMFMAIGYEERSDDGYTKAMTLAGSPGYEKWRKEGKDGEVAILVANRFLVNADGNNVENIEVLRKAVQAVDLNKLAGMK
jgi:hypothetical protein